MVSLTFQSTPVITDGRTPGQYGAASAPQKFQSTPVITDGRTVVDNGRSGALAGFNPRPSSLTGEPTENPNNAHQIVVSIHARHH